MKLVIEFDREDDGRWIAEVVNIPGVTGILTYGATQEEARNCAVALAKRVVHERIEYGEISREILPLS